LTGPTLESALPFGSLVHTPPSVPSVAPGPLQCAGLINNVLYVIILSAALDLVGPSIPKGVVLLADVIPSFLTKLVAPYFIHKIPYHRRIIVLVTLSICGMLLIALTPASRDSGTIAIKLIGTSLASFSSGLGELSFLGLTHFYGHFSLAAWGSGTGGAGLIGAGAYVAATTWLGLSVRTSLLTFSFLPLIMIMTFFVILPREHITDASTKTAEYTRVNVDEPEASGPPLEEEDPTLLEYEGLLSTSVPSARSFNAANHSADSLSTFKVNLKRASKLFFP
jgi:battenin